MYLLLKAPKFFGHTFFGQLQGATCLADMYSV